ncbi:tetratricopeptide repeat protein [Desulfoferula mesophila]
MYKNAKVRLSLTLLLALTLYTGCAAIEKETGGARRLNKGEAEKLLSVQATKDLARTGSTASDYVSHDPAEIEKQADSLVRNGEWVAALYQYQRLFVSSKDPEVKLRARYKAGRICLLTGQYNQALQLFLYLCEKKPGSAEYQEGLGLAQLSLGDTQDAIVALTKALSIDNNLWRAHNALGIAYNQKLKPQSAVPQFQTALKIHGHNAMIYNNLGIAYQLLGNVALAEKQFNKALEIDPNNTTAKNNLAVLMLKKGNKQDALWLLKESVGESKANHDIGMLLLWINNKKESSKYLEQAIYLSPRYYPLANKHLKQIKGGDGGRPTNEEKGKFYIPKGMEVGGVQNNKNKSAPGASGKKNITPPSVSNLKEDTPVINSVVSIPIEKAEKPIDTRDVPAAPKPAAPKPAAPKPAAPKAAAPKAAAPKPAAPKAAAPEAASPKAAAPEAVAPKVAGPETVAPKAASPKVAAPKAASPEAVVPKADAGIGNNAKPDTAETKQNASGAQQNINDKKGPSPNEEVKAAAEKPAGADKQDQNAKDVDVKSTGDNKPENPNKNWGVVINKDGVVSLSSGDGDKKSEEILIIQQK